MRATALIAMAFFATSAFAGEHDPKIIAGYLKDAKITLLGGIEFAEQKSGPATSAKFEVEDGKLMLSIYTVPEGLGTDAENATLTELAGVATEPAFAPKSEVFADKAHIARASEHLVLMQISKLSLKEVVRAALKKAPGTPIDVRNPTVREKRPVADVVIIEKAGMPATVSVDLLSGNAARRP
jgi:hypothetical protein